MDASTTDAWVRAPAGDRGEAIAAPFVVVVHQNRTEAAGAYGETVRDPADVGPALRCGLAQIRNGRPAVISVWMQRLLGPD